MMPTVEAGPADASAMRIFAAPAGTSTSFCRDTKGEPEIVPNQPALLPEATKCVSEMKASAAVRKPTVTRISPLVMPYISDQATSKRSPGLAWPLNETSEYHSP